MCISEIQIGDELSYAKGFGKCLDIVVPHELMGAVNHCGRLRLVNQTHCLWEHLRFLDLLVVLDEWILDWTALGVVDLHKSAAGGIFVHGIHNSVGAMVLLLHQIVIPGACLSLQLLFTVGKSYLASL